MLNHKQAVAKLEELEATIYNTSAPDYNLLNHLHTLKYNITNSVERLETFNNRLLIRHNQTKIELEEGGVINSLGILQGLATDLDREAALLRTHIDTAEAFLSYYKHQR